MRPLLAGLGGGDTKVNIMSAKVGGGRRAAYGNDPQVIGARFAAYVFIPTATVSI